MEAMQRDQWQERGSGGGAEGGPRRPAALVALALLLALMTA
jgi:hypothetical protein